MKIQFSGSFMGILLTLLCLSTTLEASVTKIDSLRWVLEQEAPNWTPDQLSPLFLELGKAYLENGEPNKALDQLLRGKGIAENSRQTTLSLQFLLHIGHAHFDLHDYNQAVQFYGTFLLGSGTEVAPKDAADTQGNLAKIQMANGKYEIAYKNATDKLLILEGIRDSVGMVDARVQIGDIHFQQENYELSLKEYNYALNLALSTGDDFSLHKVYSALSKANKSINKKDRALFYNKKALAIAELHGDPESIAIGKKNNGQLYMELGLYELAAKHFEEVLEIEIAADKLENQVSTYLGLGTANVLMGEPDAALYYLDEAQCIATRLEMPRELSNIYNMLAEANAMLGNQADGYHFLKSYVAIRDTLVTEYALKEMGQVKNQYELESRENQIALLSAEKDLLQQEKKIKGLYWFLLFAFATFFTVTGFVIVSKSKMQQRLFELLEHKSQKIKDQNAKLAQSNLDLQQFASVASHDLREPLRMINSYTKLLNRKYSDSFDASAKEFMHFITDAATRMDRMLTDLLDYSRAQNKGERAQWVSSQELVAIALDNLKFKIDKKQVVINYEKSHLPKLHCNKTAMIQLFQNLIGNAVKFTNAENPEVIIDCVKRGGQYHFSIRDTGIGIKKENQEKIFDMFQRLHTQQEFEGTGIGLATCKKIVERHQGKIWVESEEGEGSTFFFSIPQDVGAN